MARVLKREAAKRDLIIQWVWYAETATVEVADRFLAAAVSGGFEKILLFYFPLRDGVDLVRVVHGSRQLGQLLAEGFFG
jgi:plasmid stabilization system protein ParE